MTRMLPNSTLGATAVINMCVSFFYFKTKLPKHVLENLHLLSDICTIDYPMPDNPKRAILYRRSSDGDRGVVEGDNCNRRDSSTSEEELKAKEEPGRRPIDQTVPSLQIPNEEYPSVLVMEAINTNEVILRWQRSEQWDLPRCFQLPVSMCCYLSGT